MIVSLTLGVPMTDLESPAAARAPTDTRDAPEDAPAYAKTANEFNGSRVLKPNMARP